MAQTLTIQEINVDSTLLSADDLREAAQSIFAVQDADFQTLKKAKWYQRFLRAVTFGTGDKKKIITDIRSLSKLQQLFMLVYQKHYAALDNQLNQIIDDLRMTNKNIEKLYYSTVIKIKPQERIADLSELDKNLLNLFLSEYSSMNGKNGDFRRYRAGIGRATGILSLPEGDFAPDLLEKAVSAETFYRCALELCAIDGELDSFELPEVIYQSLQYLSLSQMKKNAIMDNLQREIRTFGTEHLPYKYGESDGSFDLDDIETAAEEEELPSEPKQVFSDSAQSVQEINELRNLSEEEMTAHFSKYLSDAEKGDIIAQYLVGKCFRFGYGTEINDEKAVFWYRRAANHGQPNAQNALANCYLEGAGVEEDHAMALDLYQKAAAQGDNVAMLQLGRCYDFGWGTEIDERKAFELYEEAYANGNNEALRFLANDLYYGIGVEEDKEKGFEYFGTAALLDDVLAQKHLAWIYSFDKEDDFHAVFWYQQAADLGDSEAQYWLGYHYQNGQGVQKDMRIALEYFQQSAAGGDPLAQVELGQCYRSGKGVAKNLSLAFSWFQKAAEQEYYIGERELGRCYMYGSGVQKDLRMALEFLSRACEHDETDGDAHYLFAETLYAIFVRDQLQMNLLDWSTLVPIVGVGSLAVKGVQKVSEMKKLRDFLQTEEGYEMYSHYKAAVENGCTWAETKYSLATGILSAG